MRMVRALITGVAALTVASSVAGCDPDAAGGIGALPSSSVGAPATEPASPSASPSKSASPSASASPPASASPTRKPVTGSGFVYPAPGQKAAAAQLPATASGSEYLGEQKTNLSTNIIRDLGFSGVINGESVWTYGDTILDKTIGGFKPMAYDSVAIGSPGDRTKISFKNLGGFGQPDNWVPLTKAENDNGGVSRFAMGGTNVIEYAPGKGLVYYLKNDRQGGVNRLQGAGVAEVTANGDGAKATRTRPVRTANHNGDEDTLLWGPDDPWYGDIGITYDPQDKKVYAYGNGPDAGVYLARVPAERADDVSAYEYWDQSKSTWYTGVKKVDRNQAVFSHHYDTPFKHSEIFGQSNAFWSNYYNTWMFVAAGDYLGKTIGVMTAPKLEGPWTSMKKVSDACPQSDGACYAMAPHPEYDASGKTILVSYTQVVGDKMTLQLRKVTFE